MCVTMWCSRSHQLMGLRVKPTRLLSCYRARQPLGRTASLPGDHLPEAYVRLPSRAVVTSSATASRHEDFRLVYTAPLKGAIRAVKVFSLCTAVSAVAGGPVLVILGNPGVPLAGRIAISSLVVLVGVSTTAILHWLTKGYVIRMLYNQRTHVVAAYTLSLFSRLKRNEFHLSESGPPPTTAGFSSFQAKGRSYFIHTDTFEDRQLWGLIIGPYMEPTKAKRQTNNE